MLNFTVGHCVATTTNYTDDTSLAQMNKFWVAQIVDVDASASQLKVKWYSTGTIDNLSDTAGGRSNRAQYRVWTGAHKVEWIPASRVLTQFDKLSDKSRIIGTRSLKQIANAITLKSTHNLP